MLQAADASSAVGKSKQESNSKTGLHDKVKTPSLPSSLGKAKTAEKPKLGEKDGVSRGNVAAAAPARPHGATVKPAGKNGYSGPKVPQSFSVSHGSMPKLVNGHGGPGIKAEPQRKPQVPGKSGSKNGVAGPAVVTNGHMGVAGAQYAELLKRQEKLLSETPATPETQCLFRRPLWSEGCGLSLSRVDASLCDEPSPDSECGNVRSHKRIFRFPYAVSNHCDITADCHSVVGKPCDPTFPLLSEECKQTLSCLYSPVEVTFVAANSQSLDGEESCFL